MFKSPWAWPLTTPAGARTTGESRAKAGCETPSVKLNVNTRRTEIIDGASFLGELSFTVSHVRAPGKVVGERVTGYSEFGFAVSSRGIAGAKESGRELQKVDQAKPPSSSVA